MSFAFPTDSFDFEDHDDFFSGGESSLSRGKRDEGPEAELGLELDADDSEAPDLPALEEMEASVRARLAQVAESARRNAAGLHSRGVRPALYETRLLRSGAFRKRPLQLHARRRLSREQGFYYSPDQIAHILSAAAPVLPAAFFHSIDQILLLPELALSDRRLLTHIYFPEERLLAFYLYPHRLDRAAQPQERARIRAHSPLRRLGLLGRVIESAAGASEAPAPVAAAPGERTAASDDAADDSSSPLHKFIIPRELLFEEEIEAMQGLHERYAEERG